MFAAVSSVHTYMYLRLPDIEEGDDDEAGANSATFFFFEEKLKN